MKRAYAQKGCEVGNCPKVHYATGLCRGHYDRKKLYGDPEAGRPPQPWKERWDDILDALTTDGGWLTAEGIQLVIPQWTERQIYDSCRSAAKRGLVEGRQVELGRQHRGGGRHETDYRWEWRAA